MIVTLNQLYLKGPFASSNRKVFSSTLGETAIRKQAFVLVVSFYRIESYIFFSWIQMDLFFPLCIH